MNFSPLTEEIIKIAREAGKIALKFTKTNLDIQSKYDNSPVTAADLAVNTFLETHLKKLLPSVGWLSEESPDNNKRLNKQYLFIIDPIDGTRAFINGWNEWCISIGLLKDNQPYIGVVFQPRVNKLYASEAKKGAYCNDKRLQITCEANSITGAFPMMKPFLTEGLTRGDPIPSLALRIISVATNQHAIALASPNSHEWDSAAATLILNEAGGEIVSLSNEPFGFNKPSVKQPPFKAIFKEKTFKEKTFKEIL